MTLRTAAGAASLLLALAAGASAADYSAGGLRISHPWSPPAPPGAPSAVGYVRITNTGRTEDVLKGVASPAIARVELHEMSMAGGIMRMRPIPGGVRIGPGETVALGPGGLHMMLIGPRRAFKAGERIPAVLTFARAGAVPIRFDVEPSPGPAAAGGARR